MTLSHLSALAAKATPGRWHWDPDDCSFHSLQDDGSHAVTVAFADVNSYINISEADAAHIAACSPEVIAALVNAVQAAKVLLVTTGGQIVDDGGVHVGTAMARERLIDALSALESVGR